MNPIAVAIAAREAMRDHRKGKPIALAWPRYPWKLPTPPRPP